MHMTIQQWLGQAADQLTDAGVPSAKLDTELLLSFAIKQPRAYLHAHSHDYLTHNHLEVANELIERRVDREPLAYIVGQKEFYGRLFDVTPATLIPRPETEACIDACLQLLPENSEARIVDVGCGSGCIGITLRLERPRCSVSLCDTSEYAIAVAQRNAQALNASVSRYTSDLLASYPFRPDVVVANLPYVDRSWPTSPETVYEPSGALFADDNGYSLIFRLITECRDRLDPGGYLILESDPRQHTAIHQFAENHGFALTATAGFVQTFRRC